MMTSQVSKFESSMTALVQRLDAIDQRLRSMEINGDRAAPGVATAMPATGESGTNATTHRLRQLGGQLPLQFAAAVGNEDETEENEPKTLASVEAIETRLSSLLSSHPYLDPDHAGSQQGHTLHHWVTMCRREIEAGHPDKAQRYLERAENGAEAAHKAKKSAFDRFDIDKDGQLDADEFQCMCAYLGLGEDQAGEMFSEAMADGFITLEEFEAVVHKAGGMSKLLKKRREHVSLRQWGSDAQHLSHEGSHVRSFYYINGQKSKKWKEARVLKVKVQNKCPDAPKDGVLMLFGFGSDPESSNWQAKQVVPPSWIVAGSDDAQVSLALREVGILEEQQAFWAKIFPEHELRTMARLVPCQREALRTVREQAALLHEKAIPDARKQFKDLGYGDRELQAVLTWIEDLAPAVVHVHIDKVGRFMEIDDFYRNQFETHTSCGALDDGNQTRIGWERELFGGCYDNSKAFERPKYGALSVMNDYRGVTSAQQYGDSYMVLKNVRLRLTLAAEDSGGIAGNRLAVLDKYAHVLNEYNEAELKGLIKVAMASQAKDGDSDATAQLLRGETVDSQQSWVTLGFPEAKQNQGVFYFEVELEEGCLSPQVGLVTDRFEMSRIASPQGVGDDAESWGVDGLHAARWHDGEIRAWGHSWPNEDNVLSESVVVGVCVDLSSGKILFSTNGKWDETPCFDVNAATSRGAALYPAISLQGLATYNFGPKFAHEPPSGHYTRNWPGLKGKVQVTSPLVGNSDIVYQYKEIQIHGEVNLTRNVQRLVANRKYMDQPKSERTWSMTVSGTGACDGDYTRAGATGEMPKYAHESGARLEWNTSDNSWELFEKDSLTPFARAKVEPGVYQPPRKGWEVPDEALGIVTVEAFKTALSSSGLKEGDIQRLADVLTAFDSKDKQMVFKKKGGSNFKDEWGKISDPPIDADAAWDAVVECMTATIFKEAGFAGGEVIESAHPYNSGPQQWKKSVSLKGSKGLDVYWGKKTSTLDSYASITIETGPLTKATAGIGAKVVVESPGDPYSREHIKGRVVGKSQQGSVWRVELDLEDLRHVTGIGEDDESDEEKDKDDEANGEDEDDGVKAEKKSKRETMDSKEKPGEVRYFCTCVEEPKTVQVTYNGDKKMSDEIAGFVVDKSSPLTPVSISAFKSAGPAQEAGVKAGWFLDFHEFLDNHAEEVFSTEEGNPDEMPEGYMQLLDILGEKLPKFLETAEDVTLTFINGLGNKLLPTASVKYDNDNKVGEEIESFRTDGSNVFIASFQEAEEEDDGDGAEEAKEEEPADAADAEKEKEEGDTGEAAEAAKKKGKKIVNLARDAGVKGDWKLDIPGTIRESGASLKLSEEDMLQDPNRLLELSGVTLVFEPSGTGDMSFFHGYGHRGGYDDSDADGDDSDEDVGMWTQVHIPQNSCTFNFKSDHDSSRTDKVRWGIFAVVVPTGPQKPTQKAVDDFSQKWASAVSRARGINADGIQVEAEDWDEGRLRALCAKYGWEFEWMTVEGERKRRVSRKAAARKSTRPKMQAPESERPDGWTVVTQPLANSST